MVPEFLMALIVLALEGETEEIGIVNLGAFVLVESPSGFAAFA